MAEVPNLEIKNKKGYIWVILPEDITLRNELQIQNRIVSELTGKSDRVVLDLINNDSIYSITIGLIMHLRMKITRTGGSLHLVNASKNCRAKLQQFSLDKVLMICKSEDEIISDS